MGRSKVLRAVLDANVFLAAFLSKNPTSPGKELIQRWRAGEWTLLTSQPLMVELIEKLLVKGINPALIAELLALLAQRAEWVEVNSEATAPVLSDPDDNHVLACALQGHANYLVTHDTDFAPLEGEYGGVKIVPTLPFLWAVRGDEPPER